MDWFNQLTVDFMSQFETEAKVLLRAVVLLVVGIPAVFWASGRLRKSISQRYTPQHGLIAGKILAYSGVVIIVATMLTDLGFPLSHLWGAAGVLGIAIGFASQTSVSNVISGLFLVAEQPFRVGDVIVVGPTTGEVLSIDTLSIKLRTFDNRFVRIPNEVIIKTEVTNNTKFEIRRIDLPVGIAYKEEIERARKVLMEVAAENPNCLQEPEPVVHLTGYGASSVDLLFAVWVDRRQFLLTKTQLTEAIKRRFDQEGIEIPFPHMSLYKGAATEPIPVEIIGPRGEARS